MTSTVFETMADALEAREPDLRLFSGTGASFEDWCLWECFAALRRADNWDVIPKPFYRTHCGVEGDTMGDLLVRQNGRTVFVEIGIVHSGTQNKWIDKLNNDLRKLQCIRTEGIKPMQFLVCASSCSTLTSPSWANWLEKVHGWSIDGRLSRSFGQDDRFAVYAWLIE